MGGRRRGRRSWAVARDARAWVRGRPRKAVRVLLAVLAVGIVVVSVVAGAREQVLGPGAGGGPLTAVVADGEVVRQLARAGLVRDGRIDVAAARSANAALPADARERHPRYDRDAFGPAWADADGNGCDQRDDVLVRDLEAVRVDLGVELRWRLGRASRRLSRHRDQSTCEACPASGRWRWPRPRRRCGPVAQACGGRRG